MSSKNIDMMLSLILGDSSSKNIKTIQTANNNRVNKQLILSSAMFWDSKKRIQKIKTLFLNGLQLKQFDDTQDFKVEQLENIQLLSIKKNHIIHLHPLANLLTLISLNISFNKVYDLNPLAALPKLQELYASNNQIKTIQSLRNVKTLKIVQFYSNKIHNFKQVIQTLQELPDLNQVDLESNPVSQDMQFLDLLSQNFPNIKKLNGQLNKSTQKIKQMSSSKGFMNVSMKSFNTTSGFFNPNYSNIVQTQKTIQQFYKKKSTNTAQYEKRKQKQNILKKLQQHYDQLDQQFEKQIIKNVRIKNRLYKIIQNKNNIQNEKEQKCQKIEEIKNLKRKVKSIKQQLFTKDKKGELLKKLFQVQMTTKKSQMQTQNAKDLRSKQQQTQKNNNKDRIERQITWIRKFEADQIMQIKDQGGMQQQEQQMDQMLVNIQNSIYELKTQLDYLS